MIYDTLMSEHQQWFSTSNRSCSEYKGSTITSNWRINCPSRWSLYHWLLFYHLRLFLFSHASIHMIKSIWPAWTEDCGHYLKVLLFGFLWGLLCTILKGSEFLEKHSKYWSFTKVAIKPSSIQLEKPKIIFPWISWLNTHTNNSYSHLTWGALFLEKSSFSNISGLGSGRNIVLDLLT